MADPFDAYKVLQVDPEADPDVIQAAYRRLARKFHPDVAPGPDVAARMTALNRAWDLVRDLARRAAYDASRAAGGAELGGGTGPETRPTDGRYRPGIDARPSGDAGARPRPTPSGSGPGTSPGAGPSAFPGAGPGAGRPRPPEEVSRDWTSGRSSSGHGYDPATMRTPDGESAAGPPPGDPDGSVLTFGRYAGWSLGETARLDLDYLEWLDRMPIGRSYRDEIDGILRRTGRRRSTTAGATDQRGLFRRR